MAFFLSQLPFTHLLTACQKIKRVGTKEKKAGFKALRKKGGLTGETMKEHPIESHSYPNRNGLSLRGDWRGLVFCVPRDRRMFKAFPP